MMNFETPTDTPLAMTERRRLRRAVILAGGEGLRMRPVTDDRPKAMAEVGGRPILDHQLSWLRSAGIREVVVSCGYRADVIEAYLGKRESDGLRISMVVEEDPLGRGGALRFAARSFDGLNGPFLAVNGDVLSDFPVAALLEQHVRLSAMVTIVVVRFRSNWGVVEVEGSWVRRFEQSPLLPYLGSAGIYCIEPEAVARLPEKGDLEESTLPRLALEGRLAAFAWDGELHCIDSLKDLRLAERALGARGVSSV